MTAFNPCYYVDLNYSLCDTRTRLRYVCTMGHANATGPCPRPPAAGFGETDWFVLGGIVMGSVVLIAVIITTVLRCRLRRYVENTEEATDTLSLVPVTRQ